MFRVCHRFTWDWWDGGDRCQWDMMGLWWQLLVLCGGLVWCVMWLTGADIWKLKTKSRDLFISASFHFLTIIVLIYCSKIIIFLFLFIFIFFYIYILPDPRGAGLYQGSIFVCLLVRLFVCLFVRSFVRPSPLVKVDANTAITLRTPNIFTDSEPHIKWLTEVPLLGDPDPPKYIQPSEACVRDRMVVSSVCCDVCFCWLVVTYHTILLTPISTCWPWIPFSTSTRYAVLQENN